VPYLSALEVCSRQGAIQIHRNYSRLPLPLPLLTLTFTRQNSEPYSTDQDTGTLGRYKNLLLFIFKNFLQKIQHVNGLVHCFTSIGTGTSQVVYSFPARSLGLTRPMWLNTATQVPERFTSLSLRFVIRQTMSDVSCTHLKFSLHDRNFV